MNTIVLLAGMSTFGGRIRNGEMLRRLSTYGLPVAHRGLDSGLEVVKSAFLWPVLRNLLLLQEIKINLMTRRMVSELTDLDGDISVIHAEGSAMGHVARVYSELNDVPYVLDLHGLLGAEHVGAYGHGSETVGEFLSGIEKAAVRGADYVLVVSHRMKDFVASSYGISSNNIRVVRNGASLSKKIATFSSKPRLVYGGMFSYWERPEDFVRLASHLRDQEFRFLLMGDGPKRKELLREIHREKLSNIEYVGPTSREESLGLFGRSQIGVAPSTSDLAREVAWPIKVMDYMACGLPVIAPLVGDWGRMIQDRGAGIVTENNPLAYRSAALELKDESTWRRASKRTLEAVQEDFQWDTLLDPLDAIYSSML